MVLPKIFFNKRLIKTYEIVVSLFGLFILYQIIRKILGGSWTTEEIILTLLGLNVAITIGTALVLAELKSDYSHLRTQFNSLVGDFKVFRAEVSNKLNDLTYRVNTLTQRVDILTQRVDIFYNEFKVTKKKK